MPGDSPVTLAGSQLIDRTLVLCAPARIGRYAGEFQVGLARLPEQQALQSRHALTIISPHLGEQPVRLPTALASVTWKD
jgi:hypothetical protein